MSWFQQYNRAMRHGTVHEQDGRVKEMNPWKRRSSPLPRSDEDLERARKAPDAPADARAEAYRLAWTNERP